MLRAHAHGTDYGPPAHCLHEDCIIKLDSEPGAAFGVDLNGANAPAGRRMLDLLRVAYQNQHPVRIEYEATSAIGGRVMRVIEAK
jgi:hypothetical protein